MEQLKLKLCLLVCFLDGQHFCAQQFLAFNKSLFENVCFVCLNWLQRPLKLGLLLVDRLEFLVCMLVKKALPLVGEMAAFGCGTWNSNQLLKLISGRLNKDIKVMSYFFNGFSHVWIMDCDSI